MCWCIRGRAENFIGWLWCNISWILPNLFFLQHNPLQSTHYLQRLDSCGMKALILILKKVLNSRSIWPHHRSHTDSQPSVFFMLGTENSLVPNQEKMEGDQPVQSHSHAQQPLQPQTSVHLCAGAASSWWNRNSSIPFPGRSRNVSSTCSTTVQSQKRLEPTTKYWPVFIFSFELLLDIFWWVLLSAKQSLMIPEYWIWGENWKWKSKSTISSPAELSRE